MMQNNLSYNLFASENAKIKGYIAMHYLERILPMAKRFTRKQQLDNMKIMRGDDLLRSFIICFKSYDADNEQSVWEYQAVKEELLNRMNY